jgi:hypothetical protein
MPSNHSIVKIPHGKNSVAYCSHVEPTKLVIFIHGFNGSAIGTWDDFPKLIQVHEKFEDADVIFFGYDSLKMQAANMKLRFYELLQEAVKPSNMPFPGRDLPADFEYPKIIIVGHSLGAVVCRLALLYAHDLQCTWLPRCHTVFFAPAHWGSRVPENFKECFVGFGTFLRAFAITKYPIIADLTTGSIMLTDLQSRTQQVCAIGQAPPHVKADGIIWAERERVVVNNRFCSDSPEIDIPGTTHTSVCKPEMQFLHPFEKLIQFI